ncbi:MAG: hypothetical protein ACYS8W_21615 [Planctomycetota bacterium]|jgi:hypothetical protein
MRYAVSLLVVLLVSTFAFAEEVVLEPKNTGADEMPDFVNIYNPQAKGIRYIKIAAPPKDVKAPEGELTWCRLLLGRSLYLMCVVLDGYEWKKLYIDRDGDNDLIEETPIELAEHPAGFEVFVIEDLPAKFKVGESELDLKIRVGFFPNSFYSLLLWNKYEGKIKTGGTDIPVTWTPGREKVSLVQSADSKVYIGGKSIEMDGGGMKLKEGKIVAAYELKDAGNMVELEVPSEASLVFALDGQHWINAYRGDGKICLPAGKYQYARIYISKELEGKKFLATSLYGEFEAKEGAGFGEIEPMKLAVTPANRMGRMYLSPTFTDASGKTAVVFADGFEISPPVLTLKDSGGKQIATHTFERG